jgi:hypothetical protein
MPVPHATRAANAPITEPTMTAVCDVSAAFETGGFEVVEVVFVNDWVRLMDTSSVVHDETVIVWIVAPVLALMASGNSSGVKLSNSSGVKLSCSATYVIEAMRSIFGVAGVHGTMMVTVYCADAEFVAAASRLATTPEQFTVTLTLAVTEQAEQFKFAPTLFVKDVLRPAPRSDLT